MSMLTLLAFFIGAAQADDITVTSRVQAVTVFRGQARVTRVATVRVPEGRSDLVFDDLPLSVDGRSMMADGQGQAVLLGVDLRAVRGTEDRDERVSSLRSEVRSLEDDIAEQRDIVARVQADIAFRRSVLPKAPDTLRDDLFLAADAPNQLATLAADVQSELRSLLREQRVAERLMRDLSEQKSAVERDIARIGSETRDARRAAVGIDARSAGTVTVELSYLVSSASWSPRYDARFDPDTNRVRMDLSATVSQSTGEDWLDAQLTMSTGAATRGTEPPTLSPFILGQSVQNRGVASATSLVTTFDAPRAADVPSDGSSRQVRLASLDLAAETVHRSVPRREPVAYLTARMDNNADWPLLQGPVNSYLGSAFVGRGSVSSTPPGESFSVSFGVDDRVSVERVRVEDLTTTQRALTSKDRQEWAFETRVTNRTGAPIELVVTEQVPATRQDRFSVSVDTTPSVEIPKEGVFSWESTLPNGEEKRFLLEYEITWPEGQRPLPLD